MRFAEDLQQLQSTREAKGQWAEMQKKGQELFLATGLPTRNDEDWKYTSTKILKDEIFVSSLIQKPEQNLVQKPELPKLETENHLFFLNGHYLPENSKLSAAIKMELVQDLMNVGTSTVLSEISELRSKVKASADSVDALNEAFMGSGIVLTIPEDKSVADPIRLTFYSDLQGGASVSTAPLVLVKVGRGSVATIIEEYAGQAGTRYLNNSSTNIICEDSSKLTYLRLQADSLQAVNIGRSRFFLKANSNLHTLSYSTGAKLGRHNHDVHFVEQGATAKVDGLYLVAGSQHVDNHTWIDFGQGNNQSTQHYKGILVDQARAVFNGRVLIRASAQKVSSDQLNNNLLLSSQAEIDSKPQLEIFADDVKATHGSTVGELNEEEVFYLLSRAIPREKALAMLSLGFVQELVTRLENIKLETYLSEYLMQAWQRIKI